MCLLCLCYFVWPPLLQVQGLSFQPSLFSPISQHSEYIPANSHTLCMACRSKIVISHIQTNFSCLTDNSECNCLQYIWEVVRTSSELLIMLEIGWKSFGTHWHAQFWSRQKSFYTFGNLWKSSKIFGNIRKSFENFGNLWKLLVNFRIFRFCGDEKSCAFYWQKVGRYTYIL